MMFAKKFSYEKFLEEANELQLKDSLDVLTQEQREIIWKHMKKSHFDFDSCFFHGTWKSVWRYVEWATIDPF